MPLSMALESGIFAPFFKVQKYINFGLDFINTPLSCFDRIQIG
jgi:hypothetical protein